MIVVLGRPGLTAEGQLDRPAGRIAVAASAEGGRVELVGSVGDDPDGDLVAVELGRAGVGHAALLRDPAGTTPRSTEEEYTGGDTSDTHPLPRLDSGDVDLGLHYLAEIQVLVVAEPMAPDLLQVVADAATYHGAALVVVADNGAQPSDDLPAAATVLEMPAEDSGAFVELVGRYAALLDNGRAPAEAWQDAIDASGWEPAGE